MEVWQFHPRAKKFNLEAVSKEINWIGVLEKKIHKTQFEDITKWQNNKTTYKNVVLMVGFIIVYVKKDLIF